MRIMATKTATKPKAKRPAKKSGTKNKQPVTKRLSNRLQLVIFVGVFAAIGMGSLLYSQVFASSTGVPAVRFVFLCSANECNTSLGNENTVYARGLSVKSWYKAQLGGKTFKLLPALRVTSSHPTSYFTTGPYGPVTALNTQYHLSTDPIFTEKGVKREYILGFHGMNHCGVSPTGNVGAIDPFKGCGSFQDAVYGHELGHLFGLNHTKDNTLMKDPVACNARPLSGCSMAGFQKTQLLNTRAAFFSSSN